MNQIPNRRLTREDTQMMHKPVRRCCTSYVIRARQIESAHTPVRMDRSWHHGTPINVHRSWHHAPLLAWTEADTTHPC